MSTTEEEQPQEEPASVELEDPNERVATEEDVVTPERPSEPAVSGDTAFSPDRDE